MRANIEELKKAIADAKSRHAVAAADIKRIEKDMAEFDNNKDSKLAELQKSVDSLNKALSKNSISVKTLQKELQASRLDAEQAGSDLTAAEEQLAEADAAVKAQQEEVKGLMKVHARVKVGATQLKCLFNNTVTYETYRKLMTSPKRIWKTNKPNLPVSTMNSATSRRPRVLSLLKSLNTDWNCKNSVTSLIN